MSHPLEDAHDAVDICRNSSAQAGASFAGSHNKMTASWRAQLNLRFAVERERTVLVERMHSGPLVVQKTLYPEGERICHAVIVHPPGGIAGGDQLQLHANLEADAHTLLTTPGAGKWYKANGRDAEQQLQFKVGERATLEWLPQETILFDAAQVRMNTQVELATDAKFAGWEIVCFGRRAAGEKFAQGHLHQRVQIWRGEELLWNEATNVAAGSRAMLSPLGLNGRTISAVFLVAAGTVPAQILEACRAVVPKQTAVPNQQIAPNQTSGPSEDNLYGVTALPEIFAARFVGDNTEHARDYFERLWQILRPWYANTEMQRPRIWST